MIVQDVVDEIIEKTPGNMLSMTSILRKITQVRDDLIRNYGPAQQQSNPIVTQYDLLAGISQYPLPCPPGNVVDVDVKGLWTGIYGGYGPCNCEDNWVQPPTYNHQYPTPLVIPDCWFRMTYRQFDQYYRGPYYYFLSGTIGLAPTPCQDVVGGLKIFHIPVLPALSVDDLNGPTWFDPNFDMVLVYGVLKDATRGADAEEYLAKYNQWKYDYQTANSGWERYTVDLRW